MNVELKHRGNTPLLFLICLEGRKWAFSSVFPRCTLYLECDHETELLASLNYLALKRENYFVCAHENKGLCARYHSD